MIPFRTKTPKHNPNREECEHYSSYLKTLEEDFRKRCGYCDDLNSYKIRSFAIDHFVPRNPKDFVHTIKPNYYFNLVYACNYCNGAKSNKFPTKDPANPNDGKVGFIIPVNSKYDDLFYRDKDGSILPMNKNELSIHIIEELNLKNPIHSLMWRFEKIISLEKQVNERLKHCKDEDLRNQHYEILKEVIEIVTTIFANND